MNTLDMEQIVDRLMGRVEWVGETNSDDEALENMATLEYLIEHLLNHLVHNMRALESHPTNYSAIKLSDKSRDILLYMKGQIEGLEL